MTRTSPHTGYEPKDNFLTETHVEFNQESVTEQRFPEQRFPEDVRLRRRRNRSDALLRIPKYKSITPNEKECLLVCRRRQCLKIERGNPLIEQ